MFYYQEARSDSFSSTQHGAMYQKQKHNMKGIYAVIHLGVHICTTEAAMLDLALISSDLSLGVHVHRAFPIVNESKASAA